LCTRDDDDVAVNVDGTGGGGTGSSWEARKEVMFSKSVIKQLQHFLLIFLKAW